MLVDGATVLCVENEDVVLLDLDEPRATYAPTPTATMITTITMIMAAAAIPRFFLLKF